MLRKEEYASGMVQRSRNIHAAMKDVPSMLSKEEYVLNMVRTSAKTLLKLLHSEGCTEIVLLKREKACVSDINIKQAIFTISATNVPFC